MKTDIVSAADMITAAFKNIESRALQDSNKLNSSWEKILTSIKSWNEDENLGQNLYEHSSVVELKNNILLVEADHSGWIQMLQLHKQYILKGLKMYEPELNIVSLAFRLKGSNATLSNVNYNSAYSQEAKKMEKKLQEEEKVLRKYEKNDEKYSGADDLPDNLKKIFENMEKSASKQ
ncbi:MAG: DUF721 domain-containing protein [Treponema sp.]|nr:DUF721 domain-containing protein [Treponema sp.]